MLKILLFLKKKNKIKIDIISDSSLIIPEYIINIKNKSKKTLELIENFEKLQSLEEQNKEKKIVRLKTKKKFVNRKTYKKKIFFKKAK